MQAKASLLLLLPAYPNLLILLIEPSQEKLVQCDKRLRMRLSESESFSSLRCAAMPADAAALLSM